MQFVKKLFQKALDVEVSPGKVYCVNRKSLQKFLNRMGLVNDPSSISDDEIKALVVKVHSSMPNLGLMKEYLHARAQVVAEAKKLFGDHSSTHYFEIEQYQDFLSLEDFRKLEEEYKNIHHPITGSINHLHFFRQNIQDDTL